jgi:large subunit ribosomal protein L19
MPAEINDSEPTTVAEPTGAGTSGTEGVDPRVDSAPEGAVGVTSGSVGGTGEVVEESTNPAGVKITTGRISAHDLMRAFESSQLKSDLPAIYVGDTVRVGVRIREGNKERIQPYEGVVIAKRHGGLNETITVRRIFQGIGVERVFMLHSPQVASLKVERRGKVRRAKLFYLRDRVGKATRVKQRFDR